MDDGTFETWTAVHVAQFACMAIMLAGLFALFLALDRRAGKARWAARFGAALATIALALCGVVLAVDGVAAWMIWLLVVARRSQTLG